MRLLTCIVTYNRLEYTKKAVESWLKTTTKDIPETVSLL
jgi:uncharacterized protein YxeA